MVDKFGLQNSDNFNKITRKFEVLWTSTKIILETMNIFSPNTLRWLKNSSWYWKSYNIQDSRIHEANNRTANLNLQMINYSNIARYQKLISPLQVSNLSNKIHRKYCILSIINFYGVMVAHSIPFLSPYYLQFTHLHKKCDTLQAQPVPVKFTKGHVHYKMMPICIWCESYVTL